MFATCTSIMGMENKEMVRVSGFSLLPLGPTGILLALCAMSGGSNTSVQLDEVDRLVAVTFPRKYVQLPSPWQVVVPDLIESVNFIRGRVQKSLTSPANTPVNVDIELVTRLKKLLESGGPPPSGDGTGSGATAVPVKAYQQIPNKIDAKNVVIPGKTSLEKDGKSQKDSKPANGSGDAQADENKKKFACFAQYKRAPSFVEENFSKENFRV